MAEVFANIQSGRYEDVLAAVQSPIIALTELVKNASDSCINKDDPIIVTINTVQKSLTITDSGEGMSKDELVHLGEAGYSTKMVGANICSPIGNPLSGCKGLGKIINIRECNQGNPDYAKCVSTKSHKYVAEFQRISTEHQIALARDVKTNINTHLKEIDLDMFVHNPAIIATDTTVFRSMQIFSPLLNYIFDILLIESD